jgi:2-(1,2-epoxy-1,2-dihydrophenyl)acetyl-CoA isomerase
MTGDKLPAAQAKEWGLIWDVADDCLGRQHCALAQRLAAMPTQALVATRTACCARRTSAQLDAQLDVERDTQSAMGARTTTSRV